MVVIDGLVCPVPGPGSGLVSSTAESGASVIVGVALDSESTCDADIDDRR